jgi:protein phosphatase
MEEDLFVKVYGLSDKGLVRSKNEDYYFYNDNIFIVADGVGGHNAGDLASKLTVEVLMDHFNDKEYQINDLSNEMLNAINEANNSVFEKSKEKKEYRKMGSTLVLALWSEPDNLFVANVGDARAYIFRKNNLELISKDHSVVRNMINKGEITVENARKHPYRNMITQAIGLEPEIKPYSTKKRIKDGDIILLCSDGLWDMLTDEEIKKYLSKNLEPKELCKKLINAANNAGGVDNITVLVLHFLKDKKYSN